MEHFEIIIKAVGGFLIAIGAALVLFKVGSLLDGLSKRIRQWEE